MTLKQKTRDNFSDLLRSIDPSFELLGRLRSVPSVKTHISVIDQQLTDEQKNYALLNALLQVPAEIQELVMNGFMSFMSL